LAAIAEASNHGSGGRTIARDELSGETRTPDSAPEGGGWSAIVLAGSRGERDELTQSFGVPFKALVPIAGQPMVGHVVKTLLDCPSIGRIAIVAQQPETIASNGLEWIAKSPRVTAALGGDGIAESIVRVAGTEAAPWPVLITTADHPLLTVEMVEHFLRESSRSDASIGVVEREVLLSRYPLSRRTWLKFKGGAYTGANLFTARKPRTADGLRVMASVESDRKSQLKMLWKFGLVLTIGGLVRALTIEKAVLRGGRKFGLKVIAVPLPFAEAGIDVDRPADHEAVSRIFAERFLPASEAGSVKVSIFDLDRTITRRGTYTAFLLHAARRKRPARLLLAPLALPLFLQYAARGCSRTRLKERLQHLFLGKRMKRRDVAELAEDFARRLGSGGYFADAVARIEKERSEGRRIILATAANGFYAEAIGAALGIDEIVSTRSHWQDDHLLPRIDGENCHGENKVRMVATHFEEAGLPRASLHVRAFTDHRSDSPLLRWADEAFVVNPRGKFRAEAGRDGWPVLDWA
jgi:HAD superfamily hydrolase (TIGR01490 family)